jgi:hypothetical protein
VRVPAVVEIAPWAVLVVWWFVVLRYRRRRWLRSAAVVVGLVATSLLADASALLAAERMSPTRGQSLALALLWVAAVLSITTYLVLRAPGEGGGGDGPEPPDDDPEPPWWPEFEREFRDYAQRARRPGGRKPRTPAGTR